MRKLIDQFLQMGIKLCLLTGVAFTFAACYGTMPPDRFRDQEPEYQKAHQKMEQQLQTAAQEESQVD